MKENTISVAENIILSIFALITHNDLQNKSN
jgi:hypothetical protein